MNSYQTSKWEWVALEDAVEICDYLRKPVNSKERAQRVANKREDELYPYYGATGQVGYIDSYLSDGEYVLLGEDGAPFLDPFAKKAYLIKGKGWVNNHAHVLKSKLNNKFLCYYLNQVDYNGLVTGTTRYKLTQAAMKRILVPTPDLVEQERIVSKIEELFSKLDASVAELKTAKEKLKVYRQAVLKEAFAGEYPRISLKEIAKPLSGYAFKSKKYSINGKYVVVKIGNVKPFHFDFSRDFTKTIEVDDAILSRYLLTRGDCLITMTGSRGKRDYGYVVMVEDQKNYLLNQRVAALRFNPSVALPKFFEYYLSSPQYRNQFFSYETGNVGQGNVGIKALTEPEVICPPIKIQEEIIQKIEFRLSLCDSIEQTIDTSLQQAEALRQSILKQAFEGRLI